MESRKAFARQFYPEDCGTWIEKILYGYKTPEGPERAVAGVVPHAGWLYSGAVAAKVFKYISVKSNPETFVLLGAVHTYRPRGISVYSRGSWETPLGDVKIDEDLAAKLLGLRDIDIIDDPGAHDGEHSLEVQAPFIKYLCPDAEIVPIAVPPFIDYSTGREIGEAILQTGRNIVVVGTTDLTHYGVAYGFMPYGSGEEARQRMRENDKRMIELALDMKSGEITEEAGRNYNACGSGALASTVEAAAAMGAGKGYLLEYTTSYDVMPDDEFRMAVGYAGIVF